MFLRCTHTHTHTHTHHPEREREREREREKVGGQDETPDVNIFNALNCPILLMYLTMKYYVPTVH